MIELLLQIMPMVYEVIFKKGSVVVYDREKYQGILRGERVSWNVNPGDLIVKGSSAETALRTGKSVVKQIGAEVLGIPYYAVAFPLIVDGQVIGGMSVGVPTELNHISEELKGTSSELATSLQQMSIAMEQISHTVQSLAESGQTIALSSQSVHEKSLRTEKVVQYINSIAKNTKLLGLNASIEAARAGEVGRGFSVVATEIQKMAVNSAGSAAEIQEMMRGMQEMLGSMVSKLEKFSDHTQNALAAIEEIGASIQSLAQTAQHLQGLAEKL
ncbi:MAG TPA: methyl-accepting chemotaxis protein [Desulfosporosinus sp.]